MDDSNFTSREMFQSLVHAGMYLHACMCVVCMFNMHVYM